MCMRNSSTLRCLAQCLASVTTEKKQNNATLLILQELVFNLDKMIGIDFLVLVLFCLVASQLPECSGC